LEEDEKIVINMTNKKALKVFIRVIKHQLVPVIMMICRIVAVIGRSDSDCIVCKKWGYIGLIESKTGQRM
jgi:hypothetical protein